MPPTPVKIPPSFAQQLLTAADELDARVKLGAASSDLTNVPAGSVTVPLLGADVLAILNTPGLDYSKFKGQWTPATNTPTIPSAVGRTGEFYQAAASGTASGNASGVHTQGNYILSDGTAWQVVAAPGTAALSARVSGVEVIGLCSALMTGATVAAAGVGDVTITNVSGQANAIQTISPLANGAKCTLIYRVDTGATLDPSGYRRAFLRGASSTVSAVHNLITDGEIHALEITATGDAVAFWFQTALSTFRVRYVLLRGAASDTAGANGIASLLAGLSGVVIPPISGLAVSSITGATATPYGVGDVQITNPGAQANAFQSIAPIAQNGKVTLVYRVDAGATLDASGYRRALLGLNNSSASAAYTLITDGAVHILEMQATLSTANQLFFQTALSTFRIHYAIIKGAASAAFAESGLQAALAALAGVFSGPVSDMDVRNMGLLTEPLTSASWTVTPVSPGEFSATVLATSNASQVINQVATGGRATLIYQFAPGADVTNVDIRLDQTGSGTAGPVVRLNTDGGVYMATLESGDLGANRLLWAAGIGNTFSVRYALLRGAVTDTTPANGVSQCLITALGLLANQGGERWTDLAKDIFLPSDVYLVAGRNYTLYGRRLLRQRSRVERLDVWLSSAASPTEGKPPLALHMVPQAAFNADAVPGPLLDVSVRDPDLPSQLKARTARVHKAAAVQTGTLKWCHLGDSLGNDMVGCLYWRIAASGATPVGCGTLTQDADPGAGAANVGHEARAGWSTGDYLGRTRPGTNPFLKTADAADKLAHPTMCFSDTAGYGTGARPSYTEDAGVSASYSIFSWNHWRQNGAVALSASEPLLGIINLGRNDGGAAGLALAAAGQTFMVSDFLATFSNGRVFIGCEGNGSAFSGVRRWTDGTAPLIDKKLELFDDRAAERIHIIPAWMHMAGDVGYPYTVSATSATNGTETRDITDDVHPTVEAEGIGSVGYQQWAEAAIGPILWAHATPVTP